MGCCEGEATQADLAGRNPRTCFSLSLPKENILPVPPFLLPATGLFSGAIANFLGLFLPLLLGAYSIPVIIDRLGVERFGTLTLVWAVIGYFGLLDFGISRALTKRVAETGDLAAVGRIVRPGLILMFGIGVIAALAMGGGYFLADAAGLVQPDNELRHSVYMIAFSMPLVLVSLGQRGILEGRQRFAAANWARVVLGVATFGMPIPLLSLYPRLDFLVAALIAGRMVVVLIQGWACRHDLLAGLDARYDRKEMFGLLRFGSWMTVSNLVSPLMVFLDRFVVGASIHAPNLAYYTTPFEVVTRLLIVPGAVTTAMFPKLVKWGQDNHHHLAMQGMIRGMGLSFLLIAPLVVGLQLFAEELLQVWLGTEFAAHGALPMRLLAWGVLFNSLAAFPFALLQGMGKPRWIAMLHIVELPLYMLLLFALMGQWGIPGVATAWLIRVAVDGLALVLLSGRYADSKQKHTAVQMICLGLLVGAIGFLTDLSYMEKIILWVLVSAAAVGYGRRIARNGSLTGKHEVN